MEIVAIDVGGTHARFAIAEGRPGNIVLGPETVLRTGDYSGLAGAWQAFAAKAGKPLPGAAGIAIAAPIDGETVRMTNNEWVFRPAQLTDDLGVARVSLVNDFAAIGHSIAFCDGELRHVCGPDDPLPDQGVVSIVGPGTGLGVAILHRTAAGDEVISTEGGHIGFAPTDEAEDKILAHMRERYGRVSVERVACGSGLSEIHAALTGRRPEVDDAALWQLALSGDDEDASAALDRFCGILGAVAGDLALAHGAQAVVIAGGLGLRLADYLPLSPFAERFARKGRYEGRMATIPVKLILHPQPGLLGAAAAYFSRYPE